MSAQVQADTEDQSSDQSAASDTFMSSFTKGDRQGVSTEALSARQCIQHDDAAFPVAITACSTRVCAVLQQCTSAKLAIEEAENPASVEVQRAMIIYICFLKGATSMDIEKMARLLLSIKLCASDDGKLMSIMDLPGDVLIIPQATLGGAVKGKIMQYHKNIAKEEGKCLYTEFVSLIKKEYQSNKKCAAAGKCVRYGTYGIRQVFSCITNGPFTHLVEI